MAEFFDLVEETASGYVGNRELAGRIDFGQDEHVGLVEGGRKLVHQVPCTCIAVRLKDRHEPPVPAPLRGVQRCPDFGRMMAVVLDHHDVLDRGLELEPASRSGVALQGFQDERRGDVQVHAHGHGGHGVGDHVFARDMEPQLAEAPALVKQGGAARELVEGHVAGGDVGLSRESVCDQAALEHRDDALKVGVVQAENDRAVEGDLVGEANERFLDLFDVPILVEVFGIDIGQDGDERREIQE